MSLFQELALIVGLYLILGLCEMFQPVEQDQPFRARLKNVGYTLVLLIVGNSITVLLLGYITPWSGVFNAPDSLLLAFLKVALAVFLWDLLFYVYHRAEHTFPKFWELHRFHHADTHLNSSSSLRHFWLESPLEGILISLPVSYAVGLNSFEIFLFGAVTTSWLYFIHANWKLHLGKLTLVIGGPQVHRIHHSVLDEHHDKNFAVYFPFIDKFFGTYYAPARGEFPPTGTKSMTTEVSWRDVFFEPFLSWTK